MKNVFSKIFAQGMKRRLLIGYLVVFLATAFAGVFANFGLARYYDGALIMSNKWIIASEKLQHVTENTQAVKISVVKNLLNEDIHEEENLNHALEQYNNAKLRWTKSFAVYTDALKAAEGNLPIQKINNAYGLYIKKLDQVWPLIKQDEREEAIKILNESESKFDSLMVTINKITDQQVIDSKKAADNSGQKYKDIILIVTSICVIAVAGALMLVVIWLARIVTKPLIAVTDVLESVSRGDLTVNLPEIKSKDEFGQMADAVKNMLYSLRDLISKVLEQASKVTAASQEISAGTEEAAAGSQMQAQETQAITETISEMAAAAEQMAANAEQAAEASEKTLLNAEQGQEVVNAALQGMQTLQGNIKELGTRSEQIGEIIEVIDDIAEQTNLLALNAAIEAARAGEHGKGFAVVADEIRKLAERSGKATKEIAKLIEEIQNETTRAVKASEAGAEASNKANGVFIEIVNLVRDSVVMVEQISTASCSVAQLSTKSASAIESVAAITEEFAASSQEIAASATSLTEMSDNLREAVNGFKI